MVFFKKFKKENKNMHMQHSKNLRQLRKWETPCKTSDANKKVEGQATHRKVKYSK